MVAQFSVSILKTTSHLIPISLSSVKTSLLPSIAVLHTTPFPTVYGHSSESHLHTRYFMYHVCHIRSQIISYSINGTQLQTFHLSKDIKVPLHRNSRVFNLEHSSFSNQDSRFHHEQVMSFIKPFNCGCPYLQRMQACAQFDCCIYATTSQVVLTTQS